MSCNLVQTINGSECIGDSRNKINSNFVSLETAVCNISTVDLTNITSFINNNFLSITGGTITGNLGVQGILLSGTTPLHNIFLTSETDNQTLTFNEITKQLTILNGNSVSLSSINTSYSDNSAKYERVFTTVQSNSATTWNYQGTDLKNLSSDWDSTYTTVQSNSGIWIQTLTLSGSNLNITNGNSLSLASLSSNASKAWGKFDTNANVLGTGYNILSVDKLNTGIYRVVYSQLFADNNYAITTSSSTSGVVIFTQNVQTSSADIHCIDLLQTPIDAIVSVVIHA